MMCPGALSCLVRGIGEHLPDVTQKPGVGSVTGRYGEGLLDRDRPSAAEGNQLGDGTTVDGNSDPLASLHSTQHVAYRVAQLPY